MPKTPMNENAPASVLVHYVRTPWQVIRTNAIACAQSVNQTANRFLGRRIALSDDFHSGTGDWIGRSRRP
jgi:hypothetical protein